jgi:hypothetical protein
VSIAPGPAADFDLAEARAFWSAECAEPSFIDPDVCEDVNIAGLRGEGTTLIGPTMLIGQDHTQFNRAQNACLALTYEGFGYETVTIVDSFGAPIFSCEVTPT